MTSSRATPSIESEPVTEPLLCWRAGDKDCLNLLPPRMEGEPRRIARHTPQTTALVNEACLKLVDQAQVNWQSRAQFMGVGRK